MKISINFKHAQYIPYHDNHKYGMRHTGRGMVKLGDYTQGVNEYYYIFDEKLFLTAVMKFGLEYKVREE